VSILEIDNVSRRFGGLVAVDGASLSVEEGAVTSLVGPNGAGKTTLFNLVSGILPLSAGEIRFEAQPISGLAPYVIARRGIGRTFQDPRIFYEMNVLEHVIAGIRLRGENPLAAVLRDGLTRSQYRKAEESARELLASVGLAGREKEKAQDLSFGEQRYLSIARTLAGNPKLILLDEPTVGLDRNGIGRLSAMIRNLVLQQRRTLLIVEHNLDVVFALSDQIHLLVAGKVVLSGNPAEIRRHPKMIEAYLGTPHAA
jgi:branched-chain amino acid transport system ATP-binding protein